MQPNIAAVILAAGQSKRLGTPKQLVEFEGESLLRRTTKTVLASPVNRTFVVLGHQHQLMEKALDGLNVSPTHTPDFAEGLSHSVRHALRTVQSSEYEFSAVLFVPCDLPLLTSEHLNALVSRYQTTGAPVVCSKFGETLGIPAIFDKQVWPEFEFLRGDKGARPIIEKCLNREVVVFEAAALDLDSPADLMLFQNRGKNE